MNFKNEKSKLISLIDKNNKSINEIINEPSIYDLFGADNMKEIRKQTSILEKIKLKLEREEMELAIVGMEGTGKSSFGNALAELEVFPHQSTNRCTYTPTELRYSDFISGEIFFYSMEEMEEKLQDYKKILDLPEEIRYYKEQDRITVKNEIENLLKDKKRSTEVNTTLEDFLDNLEAMEKHKDYIGNSSQKLNESQINNIDSYKEYVTDKILSRTVKKIVIFTSRCIKNTVIYDVPGFNSPSKIHREQTLEKLKEADAVVFLRDFSMDRADFDLTQISIFDEYSPEDDINLREKVFIFANKIDRTPSISVFEKNKKTLEDEISKYLKLTKYKERIFYGSSHAFLEEKCIISGNKAIDELKKLKLENEIDKLKFAFKAFFEEECFNLLSRKVKISINNIIKVVDSVLDNNKSFLNSADDTDSFERSKQKERSEKREKIKKDIHKRISDIKGKLQSECSTKDLEKTMKAKIENIFKDVTPEKLKETKDSLDPTYSMSVPPDKINHFQREKINAEYKIEFYRMVSQIFMEKITEKEKNISAEITEIVLPDKNIYWDNLKVEFFKYIDEKTSKLNEKSILTLAKRFCSNVFDILIAHPINSNDRETEIKNSLDNILMLVIYAHDPAEFLSWLTGIKDGDRSVRKIASLLKKEKNEKKEIRIEPDKEESVSGGLKINVRKKEIKEIGTVEKLIIKEKVDEHLINLFFKIFDINSTKNTEPDNEHLKREIVKPEDVLPEINNDIKNLQKSIIQIAIPAMDLDVTFKNILIDRLTTIKKIFESTEFENEFWIDNYDKIYALQYADKQKLVDQNKTKRKAVQSLKSFLDNLKKKDFETFNFSTN